jgi:hypothetical protein
MDRIGWGGLLLRPHDHEGVLRAVSISSDYAHGPRTRRSRLDSDVLDLSHGQPPFRFLLLTSLRYGEGAESQGPAEETQTHLRHLLTST